MSLGSIVSRVLGVVRNSLLVACVGGLTGASTAFQTANTLPNTIFMMLSTGFITATLVPQVIASMTLPDGGQERIDRLLTLAFGLIIVFAVVATLAAGPLITLFQLHGPVRDLGILFAYVCLPQITFYGLYAVVAQVLNARGVFAPVMWTPALANAVHILGMIIFLRQYVGAEDAERWTPGMVWLLAGTATAGIALQAAALLPPLRATGFRFRPRWGWKGHGFRSLGTVAGWMSVALLVAQAGGVVVQATINHVSESQRQLGIAVPGIMVYSLAFQTFMVPFSVVTTSILTALFPRLSVAAHEHDVRGLQGTLRAALRMPSLVMTPITVAAVVLAEPGTAVVNPSLTAEGVRSTAAAFAVLSLGLVPTGIVAIQQRYFLAHEDGRSTVPFQLIVTAAQVVSCAAALTVPARWAVATISMGQTVGNLLAAGLFLRVMNRRLTPVGGLGLSAIARDLRQMALCALGAGTLAWAAGLLVRHGKEASWMQYLGQLTVSGAVFGMALTALAWWSNVPGIRSGAGKLRVWVDTGGCR